MAELITWLRMEASELEYLCTSLKGSYLASATSSIKLLDVLLKIVVQAGTRNQIWCNKLLSSM